jgi:Mg-chelatase subunit ChlD
MKTNIVVCATVLSASFAVLTPRLAAQSNKQVFVTVVDATGAPVTDLQPGDFDVREAKLPRKIVRASLSNDPMRIALIVDSSETVERLINNFRAGLSAFLDALPTSTEVAVMSIGRQARLRQAPTTDRKKLSDLASGFFADGGGTAALDGVMEGYSRFLRRVEARWPVLVLITTDGPVTGTVREDEFERYLKELQSTSVTAHAIVVSTRGNGVPTIVAMNVTQATGGSYEAIAAATALPDKMKALGARLASQFRQAGSQYRVEYLSETKEPLAIEVGVTRSGVKLTVSDRRQLK